MASQRKQIDAINGPLLKNLFAFTLPLMFTGLLQILYNTADKIVLSQFSTVKDSLAAVGATTAITTLTVNLFMGLSVGVNVVSAKYYGKGDPEGLSKTTHTAISVSLIGGIALGIFGILASRTLLEFVNVDESIIDMSVSYMAITFAGLPAQMLYNFGSALLRSVGETKKPMYFLLFSGALNVVLNMLFVIVLDMNVEGVALATIISQIVSAALVLICLSKLEGASRFVIKKLAIHKKELLKIIRYGLPAGIQTSLFSFSNVILQSEINSYGTAATAGNTAANDLENFVYVVLQQFSVAALTFTSQNLGAKNYTRVKKIVNTCICIVFTLGLGLGALSILFKDPLLAIYLNDDAEAIRYGGIRFIIIQLTDYFLIMQDIYVGTLRAMGYSISSMIISVSVICGSRILWLYSIYALMPTITVLYIAYPVSWILACLAQFILYKYATKKKFGQLYAQKGKLNG